MHKKNPTRNDLKFKVLAKLEVDAPLGESAEKIFLKILPRVNVPLPSNNFS